MSVLWILEGHRLIALGRLRDFLEVAFTAQCNTRL